MDPVIANSAAHGIDQLWQQGIAITVLSLVCGLSLAVAFFMFKQNQSLVERIISMMKETLEAMNKLRESIDDVTKKN